MRRFHCSFLFGPEVRCIHDPASAVQEVLVINRGRLVVDGMVTEVLNTMKHSSYPYSSLETWRYVLLMWSVYGEKDMWMSWASLPQEPQRKRIGSDCLICVKHSCTVYLLITILIFHDGKLYQRTSFVDSTVGKFVVSIHREHCEERS